MYYMIITKKSKVQYAKAISHIDGDSSEYEVVDEPFPKNLERLLISNNSVAGFIGYLPLEV